MDHRVPLDSNGLLSTVVPFNVSKRKSQDLGFAALYLLLLLTTLGFAAYGASIAIVQQPGGAAPVIAVPVEPVPPAPPVGYAMGVPVGPP